MVSSTMSFQRSPRGKNPDNFGSELFGPLPAPSRDQANPAPTYNGQVDQAHILFFLRQVSE